MKKLITVLLAFVASLSLVLFAACESDTGGETTVVITASLSKTQANVGEEVTVEYSATGGVAVTVTYAKDGGAATPFTGNAFTASEAGTYVFTFTAEGAETVTKTLTVSQPSQPAATVITVTVDGEPVQSGATLKKTTMDEPLIAFESSDESLFKINIKAGGMEADLPDEGYVPADEQELPFPCEQFGGMTVTLTFMAGDAEFVLNFEVEQANPILVVTVDGQEYRSDATISAAVNDSVTISSDLVGVGHGSVQYSLTYNGGRVDDFIEDKEYTFTKAGEYKYTATSNNIGTVTITFIVTGETQPEPVISVTIDGDAVTSGSSVTKKVGERISAKVSVTNVAAGGYKISRYFNDVYLDDVTDSISAFENYTFGESDIGTIRFECYIGEETQPLFVFSVTVEATAKITASLSEDSIEAYETVNITCSAATVADQTPVSVEIRYKEANDNAWRELSGSEFTPTKAGAYSIRFKAEGAKTVTLSLTVTEHVTHQYAAVELDYDAGTMTEQWTHSVNCSLCNNAPKVLTVPSVSATGSDWKQVSVEKQPSCIEGEGTYRITVEGVVITVKKVPIPATGAHSYDDIEIDYADLTDGNITAYSATLNCTGNCGTALVVSSLPAFTDAKWSSQVTSDPTCSASGAATYTMEYTANDGSGKQASVIITVKGVPVPATGEHNWSDYEMTSEYNYERHCQNAGCDASESHAVTELTIAQAPEYLVMESNGDVSLDGFTVVAGFSDPELSYTLTEENKADAAQFSNKTLYGETTVTFNFGVQATSDPLVIYEIAVAAGTVTAAGYEPGVAQLKTFTGEAELHFTVSNLTHGNGTNGDQAYYSWLIYMQAGSGATNILRTDDFCLDLWGNGNNNAAGSNGLYTNEGDVIADSPTGGTIDFVITRTFVTDHYEIVVDITDGTNTRKVTFKEPASNGNTMTFWLGGDTLGGTGSYNYSDVLYRETGLNTLTVDSISAENISVPLGTSLETVKSLLTVTASYKEGGLDEPVPFNLSGSYNGETADTYTLTVTYGSDESISCPVQVTVEASAYTKIAGYSVQDGQFTDGTTAVTGGSVTADGFVADAVNTVKVANPYVGKNSGALTVSVKVKVDSLSPTNFAPIIGFKASGGFFSILLTTDNHFQLSYNAYYGEPNPFFDVATAMTVAAGETYTVTVTCETDGLVTLYVNGISQFTVEKGTGNYAAIGITPAEFVNLNTTTDLYFFGGSFGVITNGVWADNAWNGLFGGSIISCDLYNGIIPAEEIAAL